MEKKQISQDINFATLKIVSKLLQDIEHCVFFGTALGLCRNNDVIKGDDDIDLLLHSKYGKEVHKIFINYGLKSKIILPGIFCQYVRLTEDGTESPIDLYFFTDYDDGHIVEKWNFRGEYQKEDKHLIIPKKIIYPIITRSVRDAEVKSPFDLIAVSEFLYGDRYKESLTKDVDYKLETINNKPQITYLRD